MGSTAAPRPTAITLCAGGPRIALNLARADTSLKASLKGKRKYAGWDNAFMAALIAG